jgi:hypothetical protein
MTDEIFVKNAMKNNTLHKIAKDLLSEQINKIIEEKSATPIREVDTATFMARMNDKLLEIDEERKLKEMGVLSSKEMNKHVQLTPAELAAQEKEREQMV